MNELGFQQYCRHISSVKSVEVHNMTQKQLDMASCSLEEFSAIQWEQNQVTCQLSGRFSLIVKRNKQLIYILLQSGNKVIKLPFDTFDAICNSQYSITYLKHLLEETQTDVSWPWLCCYCGAQLMTEADCNQHEERKHTADRKQS